MSASDVVNEESAKRAVDRVSEGLFLRDDRRMPYALKPLNEKQRGVLEWVGRGCPADEYADDGYGHRVIARGLANRGLIRIAGAGEAWRATLTADGKSSLSAIAEAEATAEAKGAAVRDLLHRLNESGGRLEFDERDRTTDHFQLLRDVNVSPYRPVGKALKLTHLGALTSTKFAIEYEDHLPDLVKSVSVPPLPLNARLGPVAQAFLDEPSDQFVTGDLLRRAARLIEAITRQAEMLGHAVRDPRLTDRRSHEVRRAKWSGHLELDLGSTVIRAQIREVNGPGGWSSRHDEGDESRALGRKRGAQPLWLTRRSTAFVPTGKLEIRLAWPGFNFSEAGWRDRRSSPLEAQLGDLFRHLEIERLEADRRSREQEAEKRARELEWERAQARAHELYRHDRERQQVLDQAVALRDRLLVEEFAEEMRRRAARGETGAVEWLTLTERVLSRSWALQSAPPAIPQPRQEDLETYLPRRLGAFYGHR